MRFFLDTANLEEIRSAISMGVISGVTTNPTLVAREGVRDFHSHVKKIAQMVDGPVSAEVISLEAEGMVAEARELAALRENVVIKIPMTQEGMRAVKVLSSEGIRTNVTLVFSPQQALLAAAAGASYVSPFVGRLDDIGEDGIGLVRDVAEVFSIHNIETEIIAASLRHSKHVFDSAVAGAHIATVPYKVLADLFKHPLTDQGIQRFLKDWQELSKDNG
ncbi:fructose-6-phosphate aldolase [Thermanaerovibrio velox]|uniref:fructose-6-phosphate aldolase n=1 Tax=Thermanaerovibrio velox TaxID=108007 RepID=UPI000593B33F|nr:fructose-6-phosphate aldolase [Thermanaerovibrio velox]